MVHHSIEYRSDGKRLSAIESRFVRNDSSKLGADVRPPFRADQGGKVLAEQPYGLTPPVRHALL
jgi:hypothetical protein